MSGHVLPVRAYLGVFAALIVLTAVTTAVAFADLGPLNDVVALSIAVVKTLLVMLVFMHVRWSGKLVRLAAGAGFLWLLILFALILADYQSRGTVGPWG